MTAGRQDVVEVSTAERYDRAVDELERLARTTAHERVARCATRSLRFLDDPGIRRRPHDRLAYASVFKVLCTMLSALAAEGATVDQTNDAVGQLHSLLRGLFIDLSPPPDEPTRTVRTWSPAHGAWQYRYLYPERLGSHRASTTIVQLSSSSVRQLGSGGPYLYVVRSRAEVWIAPQPLTIESQVDGLRIAGSLVRHPSIALAAGGTDVIGAGEVYFALQPGARSGFCLFSRASGQYRPAVDTLEPTMHALSASIDDVILTYLPVG